MEHKWISWSHLSWKSVLKKYHVACAKDNSAIATIHVGVCYGGGDVCCVAVATIHVWVCEGRGCVCCTDAVVVTTSHSGHFLQVWVHFCFNTMDLCNQTVNGICSYKQFQSNVIF